MRLRRIKLAGFKSFVDPTTLQLPGAMAGIVGPNGCGKSNIIDAVRWVMGESSRHLRGDSMEDVIFNGSASRKPVGQASVELVFDNTEGRAGGQFARFNEISVRRVVARDGQSKYYLNGSRCRRRDVVDLFLGTGLGPRSYAIIEQGMISRLVEARPEELRIYLEEAAGISKYKERRRETENRIRHTRENLERLDDLRQELDKQLDRLKRQARTAERYKALKEEERRLQAELLALRLRALERTGREREAAWREAEAEVQRRTEALHAATQEIEVLRDRHHEAQEALGAAQAAFYDISAEVSRSEQALEHARQEQARRAEELREAQAAVQRLQQARAADERRLAQAESEIDALEPRAAAAAAEMEQMNALLAESEANAEELDTAWEALGARLAEPRERARAEHARLEQLTRQVRRMQEQRLRLEQELQAIPTPDYTARDALAAEVKELHGRATETRRRMDALTEEIEQCRATNRTAAQAVAEAEGALQEARGRLSSLEALQEAALGKRRQAAAHWLSAHGLAEAPRLAQVLEVEPAWEHAVETVLGGTLEAVVVDAPQQWAEALEALESDELILLQQGTGDPAPAGSLAARLRSSRVVPTLLHSVYAAEDLGAAWARVPHLRPGESVITPSGTWLGPDWVRVSRGVDEHAGVLARAQEIRTLQAAIDRLTGTLAEHRQRLEAGRERLRVLERALREAQGAWEQARRRQAQLETELERVRARMDAEHRRRERLESDLRELSEQIGQEQAAMARAEERRARAEAELEGLTGERTALAAARERARAALTDVRRQIQGVQSRAHALALQLEAARAARRSAQEALARVLERLQEAEHRLRTLQTSAADGGDPLELTEARLKALRDQRRTAEAALRAARERVQAADHALREAEHARLQAEQGLEQAREQREARHVAWQEVEVRARGLCEQLQAAGVQAEQVLSGLPEDADAQQWAQQLEAVAEKIRRLGPINLAAIDEFEEQSERKVYLDRQHADLSEALATLERAIQKIDRETRQRFRETFDKVNERLQETFPRLFGGGHAHLEMTSDDLLDAGVAILARPPGKRLSTIHLMSGGEKALTAVALVFAFFELNPAPFCMLDEVDAPLDEANVGRFCELVREMSERVQFVFITHNKTTMEFAEHLLGVTMHEPGVSRLVAVDVDEAVRMANA
ncbi:MAG TPA: chromosome segregation protein SMC [Chromatiales bacterium]|nr:chromosome segregation protein SMC [Chromatiales bacterium]